MMRFCQALSLEHKLLLCASHNLAQDVCHLGDDARQAECCHEERYSGQINTQKKTKMFVFKVKEGY